MTFDGSVYLVGYVLALVAFEHKFIRQSWRHKPARWLPAVISLLLGLHLSIKVIDGYNIATSGAWMMLFFGVWLIVDCYYPIRRFKWRQE